MKFNRKTKISLLNVFGLAIFFLLSASNSAKALESGKVILDKDFGPEAANYLLKTQPLIADPFTGAKQADMEEILPFYTTPLTKYNISVNSPNGKQVFAPGESLTLNGKISYDFDSKESQKALDELKDCKTCASQNLYLFPSMSDVGVYAQVWRKDEDPALSKKGDFLVDEFYAAQGLNLVDNQSKDFQLKWQVPAELKSGNYYVFFFINSHQRFSLAGSPLVAFDQAATFDFSVPETDAGNGIELDKNNITINGQPYVYRQPAPEIAPDNGKITINIPLTNLSRDAQNASITYNLYDWGQEDPLDQVSSKQENKPINAGDKTNLEFSFNPGEAGSVYNLKIKAAGSGSLSTADIRFVIKGIDRGIVRYLGQAQNKEGKFVPVFCLRNATWNSLFHAKVKITAWSQQGDNLRTLDKEGTLRPEDHCYAIADSTWLADGKVAKLSAVVYDDKGNKTDEKSVELTAPEKSAAEGVSGVLESMFSSKAKILTLTLAVILLIIGGYIILRNKKQS